MLNSVDMMFFMPSFRPLTSCSTADTRSSAPAGRGSGVARGPLARGPLACVAARPRLALRQGGGGVARPAPPPPRRLPPRPSPFQPPPSPSASAGVGVGGVPRLRPRQPPRRRSSRPPPPRRRAPCRRTPRPRSWSRRCARHGVHRLRTRARPRRSGRPGTRPTSRCTPPTRPPRACRDAAAIESAALHAVVTWVSASASRNWSIAASSQSCSMSYPVMFRYVTQPISCSFACVAPSFLDTGPVATYTGGPMPAFASLHASRNALYASPALLFRRFCFAEASRRAALNPLSLSLPNMLFCAIFITSVTCGDGRKSSCASFAVHASKACEPRHVHHSRLGARSSPPRISR